jgi:hypothetical protein
MARKKELVMLTSRRSGETLQNAIKREFWAAEENFHL